MFKRKLAFLSNPAEYLETMRSEEGKGTFDKLSSTLQNVIADAYGTLTVIGFGLIGIVLVAAFILFGVLKDNTAIKENKQHIMRAIIAAIGIGCVLTIIGIAAGIGQSIK